MHATVFGRLVGMPGAMVSVRDKCVYGDEDEMRGSGRAFMMHSCYTAGSTH
jgi:hypothetical protein